MAIDSEYIIPLLFKITTTKNLTLYINT